MTKLIFLSHIHEEKELALIIQEAIEYEFSGFVKVFVSSDGTSIPSGTNFLTRIEDALIDAVAGIYLISPRSVKRNWINFELGALWIRNIINLKNGENEIPTIPFCHSGQSPSTLPMPLTNLNSINATNKDDLERVFTNIQTAVGGSGKLKTDFNKLKIAISDFVKSITISSNLLSIFEIIQTNKAQIRDVAEYCHSVGKGQFVKLDCNDIPQSIVDQMKTIIDEHFTDDIKITQEGVGMGFTNGLSQQNAIDVKMEIKTDYIIDYADILLENLA